MLGSRNKQLVADSLKDLSFRLGFRAIDGFAERVVYREFFPRGLTALDDIDEAIRIVGEDGVSGLKRRHRTASRYISDFGVAMYCGFGRQPGADGLETMREHRRVARSIKHGS